jgi:hypothetical protein
METPENLEIEKWVDEEDGNHNWCLILKDQRIFVSEKTEDEAKASFERAFASSLLIRSAIILRQRLSNERSHLDDYLIDGIDVIN